jgi:hypothetical protein
MGNIKTKPNKYQPLKLPNPLSVLYEWQFLIETQQQIVAKYIKDYSTWMQKELAGTAEHHSTGTARFNLISAMQDLGFLYKKSENQTTKKS